MRDIAKRAAERLHLVPPHVPGAMTREVSATGTFVPRQSPAVADRWRIAGGMSRAMRVLVSFLYARNVGHSQDRVEASRA